MRKKYVIIKLLMLLSGYASIALVITTLILTIFGKGSAVVSIILVSSLGLCIVSFCIEQSYQRKIDEIDYDDLPF